MNKYQEALNYINKSVCTLLALRDIQDDKVIHNLHILQEAVDKANKYDDKETPKKPIRHLNSFYRCGNCDELFQNHHYQNRCPECGQKLGWSDTNESNN